MNFQNFTTDNNLQQTSQTGRSKAGKPELAEGLMDIQPQSGCFEPTQPRIMLDSS